MSFMPSYCFASINMMSMVLPCSSVLIIDINSFVHFGYLYSAHSRNLLRGALSPATVKKKCLEKLAERRHVF